MNFLLFFGISTWPISRALESFDTQLFGDDSRKIELAIDALSKSEMRFSLELYKNYAKNETECFAVSTADAFISLSKLAFGASGESQRQLSRVLGYSPDNTAARLGLQDIIYRIERLQFYGAWTNNAIFHAFASKLEHNFRKIMDMIFHSMPEQCDSWDELEDGYAVYEWSRLCGIAHPYEGTIEAEGSLLIVGAAVLLSRFNIHESRGCYFNSTFNRNIRNKIDDYDFVKIIDELNYGEFEYHSDSMGSDVTAQYIKFTWTSNPMFQQQQNNTGIETIVILPHAEDCITELEKNINEATIRGILSNSRMHSVTVTLPKNLNFDSVVDLATAFHDMKLSGMFRESNDFEKIISTERIKVGPVLYQSEIRHRWNDFPPCSNLNMEISDKTFNADRPFVILNVFKDDNPLIISMARYGWTADARDEIFV